MSTSFTRSNLAALNDLCPGSEYFEHDDVLLDLLEELQSYMNLRERLGGHVSTEGKKLRAAWDAYVKALQSEQ